MLTQRELTWLSFNRRVLSQASDPRKPLLERVRVLSIAASNLDEPSMKRIDGEKQGISAAAVQELLDTQTQVLRALLRDLADCGIHVRSHAELEPHRREWLRRHYLENIAPLVTPLSEVDELPGRRDLMEIARLPGVALRR